MWPQIMVDHEAANPTAAVCHVSCSTRGAAVTSKGAADAAEVRGWCRRSGRRSARSPVVWAIACRAQADRTRVERSCSAHSRRPCIARSPHQGCAMSGFDSGFCERPQLRWYPHEGARHAIPRQLKAGEVSSTRCGEPVTLPAHEPSLGCEPECAECDRLWREDAGLPQRPVSMVSGRRS